MDTIADTPEQIQRFRLCVIRRGLELEIKTGMRHSHNATLRAAQQLTGAKTRKKCLAKIKELLHED
jgi:hypothetical protein